MYFAEVNKSLVIEFHFHCEKNREPGTCIVHNEDQGKNAVQIPSRNHTLHLNTKQEGSDGPKWIT